MKQYLKGLLGLFFVLMFISPVFSETSRELPSMSSELEFSEKELKSYPKYEQRELKGNDSTLLDFPGESQKRNFGGFDKLESIKSIKSDIK